MSEIDSMHNATSEHQSPSITEQSDINPEMAQSVDGGTMGDEQSEDAISSSPSMYAVQYDDYDYRGDSDAAYGEGEMTSLTYDSSTTTCASSPAPKGLLLCEDEVSCGTLLPFEIGDTRWTPPPSSSPLQDLSQAAIMSSPIRQTVINEDEKDDSSIIFPQSSPDVKSKYREEHVNDTNDVQDVGRSGKRKRSESLSALGQPEGQHFPESELNSAYRDTIPNPKRLTVRSQRFQHEKLKTPFRSPLLIRSEHHLGIKLQTSSPVDGDRTSSQIQHATNEALPNLSNRTTINKHNMLRDVVTKYRTARAATQFKSPLSSDATMKLENMVRMTPDIQMLERRLQLLKRALRIKQEDQENVLEDLVRKWTDAGREVAWELWSLVKDSGASNCAESLWSPSVQGWGWNESTNGNHDSEEHPEMLGVESNDTDHGNNYDPRDSNLEEGPVQNSLGIMLRRLGIDPETLGWNEGESMFVDN